MRWWESRLSKWQLNSRKRSWKMIAQWKICFGTKCKVFVIGNLGFGKDRRCFQVLGTDWETVVSGFQTAVDSISQACGLGNLPHWMPEVLQTGQGVGWLVPSRYKLWGFFVCVIFQVFTEGKSEPFSLICKNRGWLLCILKSFDRQPKAITVLSFWEFSLKELFLLVYKLQVSTAAPPSLPLCSHPHPLKTPSAWQICTPSLCYYPQTGTLSSLNLTCLKITHVSPDTYSFLIYM